MSDLRIVFLLFLLYSFIGWLCESIYCSVPAGKWINRGFLNGPVCPVYGVGGVLVALLLTPFQGSPPLLFACGMAVTSVLEYVTGLLLETIFHTKWWDYSGKRWNLHGRVCLQNSLLFGVMSAALMYGVHPRVLRLAERIPPAWLTGVSAALLACFLADAAVSVRSALQLSGKLRALQQVLDEIHLRTETALTGQRLAAAAAIGVLGRRAEEEGAKRVAALREAQARLEKSMKYRQRRLLEAFPTMRAPHAHESLARLRAAAQETREALRRRREKR